MPPSAVHFQLDVAGNRLPSSRLAPSAVHLQRVWPSDILGNFAMVSASLPSLVDATGEDAAIHHKELSGHERPGFRCKKYGSAD